MTTEEFIKKAIEVHGDKYDYSKAEYTVRKGKVHIICPKHGDFYQQANHHLEGRGCRKCGAESMAKKQATSVDGFIEKAILIHGDKYDYSKVEYINCKQPVTITCKKHGDFCQTPDAHLNGKQGCPICGTEHAGILKIEKSQSIFENRARLVHGDKYNYAKTIYAGPKNKIVITCPIHGDFTQAPYAHLNGCGCPHCNSEDNINETKLFQFLKQNCHFNVEREKNFSWLGRKRLDCYIKDLNVAIEYQGQQHFIPVDFFGGEAGFKKTCQRDIDKLHECTEHGIHLLYFSYSQKIPSDYIGPIYNDESELLKKINSYGYR